MFCTECLPAPVLANGPASTAVRCQNSLPVCVLACTHGHAACKTLCGPICSPMAINFFLVTMTKPQHLVQSIRCHATTIVHEHLKDLRPFWLCWLGSIVPAVQQKEQGYAPVRGGTYQTVQSSKFCMSMQNLQETAPASPGLSVKIADHDACPLTRAERCILLSFHVRIHRIVKKFCYRAKRPSVGRRVRVQKLGMYLAVLDICVRRRSRLHLCLAMVECHACSTHK